MDLSTSEQLAEIYKSQGYNLWPSVALNLERLYERCGEDLAIFTELIKGFETPAGIFYLWTALRVGKDISEYEDSDFKKYSPRGVIMNHVTVAIDRLQSVGLLYTKESE